MDEYISHLRTELKSYLGSNNYPINYKPFTHIPYHYLVSKAVNRTNQALLENDPIELIECTNEMNKLNELLRYISESRYNGTYNELKTSNAIHAFENKEYEYMQELIS